MESVEAKLPQNPPLKTQKLFLAAEVCLRIMTVATTLAATWLMLTNKQTILIGDFVLDARYTYSSAFKFFVYANIIVSAMSLLSIVSIFFGGRKVSNPTLYFLLFLVDLMMMSLVLAGNAAATAIGMVGKYGNSHTGWVAICDHFGTYCRRSTSSVSLSYLSLLFLVMLTIMSARNSRQIQV